MRKQPRFSLSKMDFPPNLVWTGSETNVLSTVMEDPPSSHVLGQFAIVHEDTESIYLCRDRIGLNKMFYHIGTDTSMVTAGHYLYDVAEAAGDTNGVKSVPAGHYAMIDKKTGELKLSNYCDLSTIEADTDFKTGQFSENLDRKLSKFFVQLGNRYSESQFFVCLSGGLDSTIIATYACRYLRNVTAVTFSYESLSDDYKAAKSIAAALGIPFESVILKREMNEETLDQVLQYCQDWRDFNVHCAWVNYHIAKHLRRKLGVEPAIVLTGDLMNEYVADYSAEVFDGTVYYPLPKVSRERLRRFFVYGLDAGDREIGIFHHWGFTLIQPFSILAEDYLTVPANLLDSDEVKRSLNSPLVDKRVIAHLLGNKTRAQIGSEDGGTLGLFHDSGIDQDYLKQRWEELLIPHVREKSLQPIIVSGRYRT